MKIILAFFIFLLSISAVAQQTETFYDADWKPCDELRARFVSYVKKTDTGWLQTDYYLGNKQVQMIAFYADENRKLKKGIVTWYHPNGVVSATGRYLNNKRYGVCYSFHSNGMMKDSAFFDDDKLKGTEIRWYSSGAISDSITVINDSVMVSISWFENGNPSSAGFYLHGNKTGTWKYFHSNGKVSCIEKVVKGTATNTGYFNEEGDPEKLGIEGKDAEFKGGQSGWIKKIESKLYWPDGYKFENGNMASTVIDIMLDENGKIMNAEVVVPFHPAFDKIALNAIKYAGNWMPAYSKNRRVAFWLRQKVTFSQPD